MQKIFFLISAILICYSLTVKGQDVITKKTGEDIISKVLEISTEEVKFKKWDNLEGPTFSIYKTDVLIIRYKNGTKDIFTSSANLNEAENTQTSNVSQTKLTLNPSKIKNNSSFKSGVITSNSSFEEGKKDAIKNYGGFTGAGTGTLVTGLIAGPVLGLVPALITSSTPPKEMNLNYPSYEKMTNADYYTGYTSQAYNLKKDAVWANWGIATGIYVFSILILVLK